MHQKDVKENNYIRNTNYTISANTCSDKLTCQHPKGSFGNTLNSLKNEIQTEDSWLLRLGIWQFIFGFLMVVSGGLVLHYESSLAQLAGGIWGGCLAMSTGILGILASAKEWCPLKSTPQKITHTMFLGLSLVSLAVSQLVMALAATGTGRDINNIEHEYHEQVQTTTTQAPQYGKISLALPENYMSIMANVGLLIASFGEFVVAAVASYKSSRVLCPCFKRKGFYIQEGSEHNKNAFVSSWLGKHSSAPQFYVVATPTSPTSTLVKQKKIHTPSHSLYGMPYQLTQSRIVRYPLIPAPLGTIPSPVVPLAPSPITDNSFISDGNKNLTSKKRKKSIKPKNKSEVRSPSREVTEVDAVGTYTGLDKTIAEEFIDICDSRNVSLCSESSCTSSCEKSYNSCCNETVSGEHLISK